MKRYNAQRRLLTLLASLALVFAVVLAVGLLAHEADHKCTGADCPVCACMQAALRTLRQLGSSRGGTAAALVLALALCVSLGGVAPGAPARSLVCQKVRMND